MILSLNAKKNTGFTFSVSLWKRASVAAQDTVFQTSPTLVAGDVKVSIDNGALANLTNLPAVTPPASALVQITLTAAEMNGDNILILFRDQSNDEWCDLLIVIRTSLRLIDDILYSTYQVPDAVAADGIRPTIEQAIYMITQFLCERDVAGTTMTVKKPDGSTALMTFALNNAVNPTSITRAT